MATPQATQNIKVWDWSIRVFHWSLPILIFLLWYSQSQGNLSQHFLFAQILLGLLVYRLIWGVIGTPYARFKNFIYCPSTYLNYLRQVLAQPKPRYLGHNPFGGLMVFVLLLALGFMLLTGLFTTDDIFMNGPLYDQVSRSVSSWMTSWHKNFFDWLLVLIGLHLAAVVAYRFLGENLVTAMFTGNKAASEQDQDAATAQPEAKFPWLRFVFTAAVAILIVVAIFEFQLWL